MTAAESPKPPGTSWPRVYSERRFGILLAILLALLAGPAILLDFGLPAGWFDAIMSLMMLAAILSLCFEERQRVFALLLGIPTIVVSLGGHALSGPLGAGAVLVGHVCEGLFLFGAATIIVRTLFNTRPLTLDSIFGAVCGYLFLGVAWAVFYSIIEGLRPGSFRISEALAATSGSPHAMPHVLTYYSFVTLATVGYGDVTPTTSTTCTLAWMEAITGQFYLAVIVAGLVSMLLSRSRQASQ
jgi:hypothetical protein